MTADNAPSFVKLDDIAGHVARVQVAVNCLRYEVPGAVWDDVNARWMALRAALGLDDPPLHRRTR